MKEPNLAYKAISHLSDRALSDIGKLQRVTVNSFRWLMGKADSDRFKFDSAVADQQDLLFELSLLTVSIDLKKEALEDGGFSHEHGPGLETVANALYEVCLWEDEHIADWFSQLVLNDDGEDLGFRLEKEE